VIVGPIAAGLAIALAAQASSDQAAVPSGTSGGQISEQQPAFSAEEDLDCAIYVGALMAEMGAEMTPDNRVGLTSALTYFVGRYEAQRGLELTQAFTERYPLYQQRDSVEIEQTCSVRMRAFSTRLQQVGGALSRIQPDRESGSDTSRSER